MKLIDRSILRDLAWDAAAAVLGVSVVALPMLFVHGLGG
jgi:hypothetical protein